jgi:hypothetical protein
MSKKQVENKKEVTVEALQKILDEQDSKIMTLSRETEKVKRNSRIMLISCIIMVFIVIGVISATVFWKPTSTWHEVARFSGTFHEFDSEDLDRFYISSDRWRIYWMVESYYNDSTDAPYEDVEFRLFLHSESNPDPSVPRWSGFYVTVAWLKLADFGGFIGQSHEWVYIKDGTEYIIGSGEFYLRLRGASLEWEIIVEAYY